MLKGRNFEYYTKLKKMKISGTPPEQWEELTSEDQIKTVLKEFKVQVDINMVQFDY